VIAFAAETEQLETNARAKLQRKRVDAVLANSVAGGAGFEQNDNCLTLITANKQIDLGCASKQQLAIKVIKQLVHETFA
jgi:phosphopantothenoylcysteine decarboxylase/phosphopantothenate--cysteine ligase